MARRKKTPSSGPNMTYMISFGDTMTALLAFFIVLNALANEQTGADIHAGTGSFIEVTDHLGVPGLFDKGMSRYSAQMRESSPLFMVESESENDPSGTASGPDADGDATWIRDREQEAYERFLNEIERFHQVAHQASVAGEISFDRMVALPGEGPLLDAGMREMIIPLIPQLRRPEFELEIVVWSPTPSKTAWTRSTLQAHQLRQELVQGLNLTPVEAGRLTASARPWLYSDVKRPVVTAILRKQSQ